jgi:hypothetical protein
VSPAAEATHHTVETETQTDPAHCPVDSEAQTDPANTGDSTADPPAQTVEGPAAPPAETDSPAAAAGGAAGDASLEFEQRLKVR